jgi:chemotaxis signal transduction protein
MRCETATHLRTRGILAFRVGGFWFSACVEDVAGLLEATRLSPFPRLKEPLAGVLAFRGVMVPAFDLEAFLGIARMSPSAPRYAMVLSRGTDRFGVVVPEIPRLVSARSLKEAEVSAPDPELAALIETVYESDGETFYCLNYWTIIDSILPTSSGPSRAAAGRS